MFSRNREVIRVLHVDSEPDVTKEAKNFIEEIDPNLQITLVSSPDEAFRLFQQETYDCVVLDYVLEGLNGIEFARKIKANSNIPVIVYTKYNEDVIEEAFGIDLDDYIKKIDKSHNYRILAKRIKMAVDNLRIKEALESEKDKARKRIDEKQLDSQRRFGALFDMAPDGIVLMDLKGFITSGNKALFDLTGYNEKEIIGKHFTKLGTIRLKDVPKYLRIFSSVIMGKDPEPFEFMYVRKNGESAWGQGMPKLIKTGDNKREILIILRDITKIKQNEETLNQLLKELERSNRELDDYTYAVSHDLKAPLRTIEAFSSFLLDDFADQLDETGEEYLRRMKDASTRMKGLIDDLLLLSRVGRLHTETELVDLNNVLKDILLDFEAQIKERGAEILVDRLPVIKTQKVWITQLFSNLISNGLKFNESSIPRVEVGYEERPKEYLFSVMDNGIGIKKKDYEKIFQIFQRLHTQDEYPGTGVGLALCKKFVESLGGNIWVDSKPGSGSTFYFTFPKEEPDESDIPEMPVDEIQDVIEAKQGSNTFISRFLSRN